MRLPLAAAAAALVLAAPARAADWQGFDWGMSEAEVGAAKSDIVVTRLETARQRKTYSSYAPLAGTWTNDGHEYRLLFYFDADGRLRDIDIELGELECSQMNDVLADRFGKFEEEVKPLGSSQRVFRRWRLAKKAELLTTSLHMPSSDQWICGAKIKKPVGR
ncbi:hypothetical protein [Erythrobacter dokdonensis]|uniref:Lipoprotein n=1 Tax=Erythrobacter dokdonensis DSW-74 TaxID=1300349 RepID=A0A1A7BLU1_9SPHN|nr:hypothetical protein [Erythrobacter dokdonensis]OBV12125.1 hypothetical protein I603_0256 [Erythrobacter dokdonensis DSW-74]